MKTLLNKERPPLYCPGCGHSRVVQTLDAALKDLGLSGSQIVIVTDIGCSGLFDTFFNTHAMHGLHGRALTYATGLKLARPELTVIVVMGDGGMGIGAAHVIASCRRNLDLNLLVLNNFNYGMTGGQCSGGTPQQAMTASGFLNQLEPPVDFCRLAETAGATWVGRCAPNGNDQAAIIAEAISHRGFSLLEMQAVCTGRFAKMNPGSLKGSSRIPEASTHFTGTVRRNERPEYGEQYRRLAVEQPRPEPPAEIFEELSSAIKKRCELLLLGAAGQRISTAGEIVCLGAMAAGLQVTRKSDYPITVLRGHSVCEVVCSPQPIRYTGITSPDVIMALSQEGVERRSAVFGKLQSDSLIIKAIEVALPANPCRIVDIDFQQLGVPFASRGVAALALLACLYPVLSREMFRTGLVHRLKGGQLEQALATAERVFGWVRENPL